MVEIESKNLIEYKMRKIIYVFLLLSVLAFANGVVVAKEEKYIICFCTDSNHAFITLYDGSTDRFYTRGLYKGGYGDGLEAPLLPKAGENIQGVTQRKDKDTATVEDDNDALDLKTKCLCFEVTKDEYNKAVNYMNNYPREYRLLSQNCLDFVEDTAEELGLPMPDSDYLGVSDPEEFYKMLNLVMALNLMEKQMDDRMRYTPTDSILHIETLILEKVGGFLDKSNKRGKYFIAYGNETDKFGDFSELKRWLDARKKIEEMEKKFNVKQEQQNHPEESLRSPDSFYNEAIKEGSVPIERKVIASATIYKQCGGDCIEVKQNIPIQFSPDFNPAEPYLIWWYLGDREISLKPKTTHIYDEPGLYLVKMRYVDASGTTKFGSYRVIITKDESKFTLPASPIKISTIAGQEIKLNYTEQALQRQAEMAEYYNKLEQVSGFKDLLGDDRTRIHLRQKDGSTVIMDLKTKVGVAESLSVLGVVDTKNEKMLEENSELFIDCIKTAYTAALYLDEETLEKIAQSENPKQEVKNVWGKKVRYKGLNLRNNIKELISGLLVRLS